MIAETVIAVASVVSIVSAVAVTAFEHPRYDLRRFRQQELITQADWQHSLVLKGNPVGIYGSKAAAERTQQILTGTLTETYENPWKG